MILQADALALPLSWPSSFLNKIICGDCLKIMRNIPEKSIDMILCDLPYGKTKNEWDSRISFKELWACYEKIIKNNSAIILFGQSLFTIDLIESNKRLWRYNLIWDKVLVSGFLNANKRPLQRHEEIIIFYKNQPTYNPQKRVGYISHSRGRNPKLSKNYGKQIAVDNFLKLGNLKHPTSILKFQRPPPSITLHPTQKPLSLCEFLIKTYSNKNNIILDNCAGSGSTLIAAKNTRRNFIGIEINPDYCKIAEERLAQGVL